MVNTHTFYLHDGCASNFEVAFLWQGGEAANAKNGFMQLKESERKQLLQFLQSL